MATLSETASWTAGIYQLETTDPVLGGPDGIDNLQAKQLANRTLWLKDQVESLGNGKQPLDATLTALAGVVTAADKLIYATGDDSFAVTPLTPFMRTLLDDIDASAARATLGAASVASPAFSGTPTAPTAALDTSNSQVATTGFVMGQAATQLEAEAGTSSTRWMSPLRVLQAIVKVVVQSTEAIAGIAKIATQGQTNAGADDATIVTPKKLRAGFSILLSTSGYIALPTWLGGFIFQWGQVVSNSSGDAIATFPLAFPYAYLGAWASYNSNANNSVSYTLRSLTKTQVYFGAQFSGTSTAAAGANTYYLAIGY